MKMSAVYKFAGEVLFNIKCKKGGIRSLVYGLGLRSPNIVRQVYALVVRTLSFQDILTGALRQAELIPDGRWNVKIYVLLVMVYDLCLGSRKIRGGGELKKILMGKVAILRRACASSQTTDETIRSADPVNDRLEPLELYRFPRYVRVSDNLCTLVAVECLKLFCAEHSFHLREHIGASYPRSTRIIRDIPIGITSSNIHSCSKERFRKRGTTQPLYDAGSCGLDDRCSVFVDEFLPCMLHVECPSIRRRLHEHILVQSGYLALQDRATCLAAIGADVQPGDRILDACAAPGSKTLHILDRLGDSGYLLALEKNFRRYLVLLSRLCMHARLQGPYTRPTCTPTSLLYLGADVEKFLKNMRANIFKIGDSYSDQCDRKNAQVKKLSSKRSKNQVLYSPISCFPQLLQSRLARSSKGRPLFFTLRLDEHHDNHMEDAYGTNDLAPIRGLEDIFDEAHWPTTCRARKKRVPERFEIDLDIPSMLVEVRCEDFLAVNGSIKPFCKVEKIVLDPSCSGSGLPTHNVSSRGQTCKSLNNPDMHARSQEHQLHQINASRSQRRILKDNEVENEGFDRILSEPCEFNVNVIPPTDQINRVITLQSFQRKMLCHALREFKAANTICYSTCSVYIAENEEVVRQSLHCQIPPKYLNGSTAEMALGSTEENLLVDDCESYFGCPSAPKEKSEIWQLIMPPVPQLWMAKENVCKLMYDQVHSMLQTKAHSVSNFSNFLINNSIDSVLNPIRVLERGNDMKAASAPAVFGKVVSKNKQGSSNTGLQELEYVRIPRQGDFTRSELENQALAIRHLGRLCVRAHPQTHNCRGFFMCVLQRKVVSDRESESPFKGRKLDEKFKTGNNILQYNLKDAQQMSTGIKQKHSYATKNFNRNGGSRKNHSRKRIGIQVI